MSKPLAVITGASSGIGLELAKVFAQEGYDLIIAAESERVQDARRELQGLGAQVEAVQADLAAYDGVETLYSRIQSLGRPVDCLVANAGVGVWGDFARDTKLEDELNLINLNVTSPVHLIKRVVPEMVRRTSGKILITSSIAATMPGPLYAVYAASKSFLLSFSEALRNELSDAGITVTALMPGVTDTDFFRRAGMEDTKAGQKEKDDPAKVARQGFDALMAGDDKVVAGSFSNKVQAVAARLMPEPVKAKVHKGYTKPAEDKSDKS